ncbi:GNAT family N-acetyltransferase [Paracoccus tegillarcae]|uniref:N-acetyltransferase n=1 Tax=Paracoccus tegillarcae TaxID=1529068 RepID=A0A2K9ECA5_9RHOB|nr:GNAT family N-acetyltransferase [Paracoccus tegillarcae]AUH32558.1 N-acetyltransferase [Paracoccus tegillarcae]
MTQPHVTDGPGFVIQAGIRPDYLDAVAEGYWQAFAGKLRYPLGPKSKCIAFLRDVMNPACAISAVSDDGRLLGVAGLKSRQSGFVGGDFRDLVRAYGLLSAIVRSPLISLLERPVEDGILLMDGIFVTPDARGLGVGTALLSTIETYAAELGHGQVRLDVVDSNPRARSLYERQGFVAQSETSTGILAPLLGFRRATTMMKPVPAV